MLDIVLLPDDSAAIIKDSRCCVYIDNRDFLADLIRGDSGADIVAVLVAHFWKLATRRDICVWFARAMSRMNPANLPTSVGELASHARFSIGFPSLVGLFAFCRFQLRHLEASRRLRPLLTIREVKKKRRTTFEKRLAAIEAIVGGFRVLFCFDFCLIALPNPVGYGKERPMEAGGVWPFRFALPHFQAGKDFPSWWRRDNSMGPPHTHTQTTPPHVG